MRLEDVSAKTQCVSVYTVHVTSQCREVHAISSREQLQFAYHISGVFIGGIIVRYIYSSV